MAEQKFESTQTTTGVELNIGLTHEILEALTKMGALDLVPKMIKILINNIVAKDKGLDSETIKYAIRTAAETLEMAQNQELLHIEKLLEGSCVNPVNSSVINSIKKKINSTHGNTGIKVNLFSHDYKNKIEHYYEFDISKLKAHLSTCYQGLTNVKDLLGHPVQLTEESYIHLQLLYSAKTEQKVKQEKDTETTRDARISSFEDLFGEKQAVSLKSLFKPAQELLPSENVEKEAECPDLLVVQGRAGIGKTIFTRYIAHAWAEKKLWGDYAYVFRLEFRDLRAGVFQLKDGEADLSLPEWVYHTLRVKDKAISWKVFRDEMWARDIETAMEEKRVLFILDGYDEMPEQHRCQGALESLLSNPKISKILTTRPYGLEDLPLKRRNLEIIGFTDDNIERYVYAYFGKEKEKADTLLNLLASNINLWSNAHIPLTLSILCGVYDQEDNSSLSDLHTMTELYQQMTFALLKRNYELRKPNASNKKPLKHYIPEEQAKLLEQSYADALKFLETLAYQGLQEKSISIPTHTVRNVCKQLSEGKKVSFEAAKELGLIKLTTDKESQDDCEFLHLTFQEFFAARYLAEGLQAPLESNQHQEAEHFIRYKKYNPRYQIVCWFVAGLLKETKEKSLEQYFDVLEENESRDLFGHYEIGLLARCLEESYGNQIEGLYQKEEEKISLFEQKIKQIHRRIQERVKDIFCLFRHEVMLTQQLPPLIRLLHISPCLLSAQDEADLFKDVPIDTPELYLRFIERGRLATPKVKSDLKKINEDKSYSLEVRNYSQLILIRLGQVDLTFRERYICALLIQLTDNNSQDVATAIVSNLLHYFEKYHTEVINCLLQIIKKNKDIRLRTCATKVLGPFAQKADTPDFQNVNQTLLEALENKDEEPFIREKIMEALGCLSEKINAPMIQTLLNTLLSIMENNQEPSQVRLKAAEATGHVMERADIVLIERITRSFLHTLQNDKTKEVRTSAANALERLSEKINPHVLPPSLVQILLDTIQKDIEDDWVYYIITNTLKGFSENAKPEIIQCIMEGLLDLITNKKISDYAFQVVSETLEHFCEKGSPDLIQTITNTFLDIIRKRNAALSDLEVEEINYLKNLRFENKNEPFEKIQQKILNLTDEEYRFASFKMEEVLTLKIDLQLFQDERAKEIHEKIRKNTSSNLLGAAVQAIGILGQKTVLEGTQRIIDLLFSILEDTPEDFSFREKTVKALGRLGQKATPAGIQTLIGLLLRVIESDQENVWVRAKAIEALGHVSGKGDAAVINVLLEIIGKKDEEAIIREHTVEALGHVSKNADAAIVPTLIESLLRVMQNNQEPPRMRARAIEALGQLGANVNVDIIHALLFVMQGKEEHVFIKEMAAKILMGFLEKMNTAFINEVLSVKSQRDGMQMKRGVVQELIAILEKPLSEVVSVFAGKALDLLVKKADVEIMPFILHFLKAIEDQKRKDVNIFLFNSIIYLGKKESTNAQVVQTIVKTLLAVKNHSETSKVVRYSIGVALSYLATAYFKPLVSLNVRQWEEMEVSEFAYRISIAYLQGEISYQRIRKDRGYRLQGYVGGLRFHNQPDNEKSEILISTDKIQWLTDLISLIIKQWETYGTLHLEMLLQVKMMHPDTLLEAIFYYESVIQLFPHSHSIRIYYHNLACIQHAQLRWLERNDPQNEDIDTLQMSVEKNFATALSLTETGSRSAVFAEWAGYAYRSKQYDKAIEYAKAALDSEHLKILNQNSGYNKAELPALDDELRQIGEKQEGIKCLRSTTLAHYILLRCYLLLGKHSEADQTLETLKQIESLPQEDLLYLDEQRVRLELLKVIHSNIEHWKAQGKWDADALQRTFEAIQNAQAMSQKQPLSLSTPTTPQTSRSVIAPAQNKEIVCSEALIEKLKFYLEKESFMFNSKRMDEKTVQIHFTAENSVLMGAKTIKQALIELSKLLQQDLESLHLKGVCKLQPSWKDWSLSIIGSTPEAVNHVVSLLQCAGMQCCSHQARAWQGLFFKPFTEKMKNEEETSTSEITCAVQ